MFLLVHSNSAATFMPSLNLDASEIHSNAATGGGMIYLSNSVDQCRGELFL